MRQYSDDYILRLLNFLILQGNANCDHNEITLSIHPLAEKKKAEYLKSW